MSTFTPQQQLKAAVLQKAKPLTSTHDVQVEVVQGQVFIKIGFNSHANALIRETPHYRFDSASKRWVFPLEMHEQIEALVGQIQKVMSDSDAERQSIEHEIKQAKAHLYMGRFKDQTFKAWLIRKHDHHYVFRDGKHMHYLLEAWPLKDLNLVEGTEYEIHFNKMNIFITPTKEK